MSEIANTKHLNQKDKDRLEYFFEKYSLAWYVEREYKRLQNKTSQEQQGEEAKESLVKFDTINDNINKEYMQKYSPNMRNFNSAVFEFTDAIRVFIKPIGNIINIYDGYIEYKKTGDELKVITKIGSNITSGSIMIAGGYASFKSAIAIGAASSVFLTPIGGAIVGIGIFVVGIGTSYWISDNFGIALNAGTNGVIDYIRATDFSFASNLIIEEEKQLNTVHFRKTIDRMQNSTKRCLLINDHEMMPPLINNQPNLSTLKNMELLREKIRLKDNQ